MFERLFHSQAAIRRHQRGRLAEERAIYLEGLVAQGMAEGTVRRRAGYILSAASQLNEWPHGHCFDRNDVEALAKKWAADQVARGRASDTEWAEINFRSAVGDFLRHLGRLRVQSAAAGGIYSDKLADFLATQRRERWFSEETCRSAQWQVNRFLNYLRQRALELESVTPSDIDAYFEHAARRWGRCSLRTCAKILRAWLAHCQKRGWSRSGLAESIVMPRGYRHEGLPVGPTWEEVGRILSNTSGGDPLSLRDHAIILLLSVYGLRSGEVRRLRIEDLDWTRDRIRIVRSKSRGVQLLPLEPRVGNAIVRYLRDGRPQSVSRVVFLTLRAPFRPLSAGGIYNIVNHHLVKVCSPRKGRGPHALRHSCARHLMDSGRTYKEVGDHLGHSNPDATRYYAKADLGSLRRVAMTNLGGLA